MFLKIKTTLIYTDPQILKTPSHPLPHEPNVHFSFISTPEHTHTHYAVSYTLLFLNKSFLYLLAYKVNV